MLVFGIFDGQTAFWTASFLANYVTGSLGPFNSHFWSLCVEVHFYLAIALMVSAAGKKGIWIVWPACLVVTSLRVLEGAYINIQTHLRVDEILAGACVATLYRDTWRQRVTFPGLIAALAACLWFVSSSPYSVFLQYLRPYAAASLLAAALCQGHTRLAFCLSSRPLRYIAAISYALYVIHPATIQGWWNQGSFLDRYILKRPISFLMTFVAAHISTFYWERLWMQAGKRWIQKRRTVKAGISPKTRPGELSIVTPGTLFRKACDDG
jgi:peptidoglycan/LPS O-acetylase OafA/YrhL